MSPLPSRIAALELVSIKNKVIAVGGFVGEMLGYTNMSFQMTCEASGSCTNWKIDGQFQGRRGYHKTFVVPEVYNLIPEHKDCLRTCDKVSKKSS